MAPPPPAAKRPPGDGPQIDSSPAIEATARELTTELPSQQPGAVANYVVDHFRYDNWLNAQGITRRASTLFDSGYLSGCSEYAVVATALLRAADIPSRLLVSVNRDWVEARRSHPYLIPRGHVFVEVHVDGAWRLLDVPYLQLYRDYDPTDPVLPRGERYCLRTTDLWRDGIDSPVKLIARLKQCADQAVGEPAREPAPPRTLAATEL